MLILLYLHPGQQDGITTMLLGSSEGCKGVTTVVTPVWGVYRMRSDSDTIPDAAFEDEFGYQSTAPIARFIPQTSNMSMLILRFVQLGGTDQANALECLGLAVMRL